MTDQTAAAVPAARELPRDLQAERAILGSVLIRPSALDDVATIVRADDFFLPSHGQIFEAMDWVWRRDRTVDQIALGNELAKRGVLDRLEGAESYLMQLREAVGTAESCRIYAKIVRDHSIRRRLIWACLEAVDRAYAVDDVEDLLGDTRRALGSLEDHGADEPVTIGQIFEQTLERIEEKRASPEKHSILTGIPEFDRRIGGFGDGQLIVVAGTPGMGKTSWGLDVALRSGVRGVPNLIVSQEMSRFELEERVLSFFSKVQVDRIGRGSIEYADFSRMRSAKATIASMPVEIFDQVVDFDGLLAIARRWRARHAGKLCLLTVDYLQLLRLRTSKSTRHMNDTERYTIMTRELKLLAKDLGIPIQLLSQLSRDIEKEGKDDKPRPPKLSDLRGSGSIEQDADMVIFIPHRDGNSGPSGGPIPAPIVIGKHRGGPTGTLKNVLWNGQFSAFYPNDEAESEDLQDVRLPGVV